MRLADQLTVVNIPFVACATWANNLFLLDGAFPGVA
jgi:hypothetical protein